MAQAPPTIHDFVARFERNLEAYRSQGYNESKLRRESFDPSP